MTRTEERTERQQWLAERRNGIGGSDAAAILGLSPWKSALELYCDKIGMGDPELDEPEYIQWGKILEPVIAERYVKETGRTISDPGEYTIQRNATFPWMMCTVDRLLHDVNKGLGVLELKTAAAFKEGEWTEEPPIGYQIQMQHSLVVTDRAWGSFAVLLGGQKFLWCDIERNEKFCAYLIEEERKFWERVQKQDPPPPGTPHDSAAGALQRLYPHDSGASVALNGEIAHWADSLETVKQQLKALDDQKRSLENNIKAAIGDATFGVLPDGSRFSLKTIHREGYTVAAAEYRQLRRLKK